MAPHFSTLALKIPWTEEPGGLQSMGSLESDTTERLHFHFSLSRIGEGNGKPLQCSCLENPRDGGAQWAVYGVAQSRTRLKRCSSSSSRIDKGRCINDKITQEIFGMQVSLIWCMSQCCSQLTVASAVVLKIQGQLESAKHFAICYTSVFIPRACNTGKGILTLQVIKPRLTVVQQPSPHHSSAL